MSEYSEKFKDPRWQKKRLEILNRDKFKCRVCKSDKKTLHVHHFVYLIGRDPWEYDDKILITLCEDCHEFIKEINFKELAIEHLLIYGCDKALRWFMKDLVNNMFNMENSGYGSIEESYNEYYDWLKFSKQKTNG